MKVLVACEFSGRVREAFRARGHKAISCDFEPSEIAGDDVHYRGDVFDIINQGWDLMIAHPPCTYLAVSGARWWRDPDRQELQRQALLFVRRLWDAPIERIAIENPVGIVPRILGPATGFYHPWEHGTPEVKKTGLWLKNLPMLKPSDIVSGRTPAVHYASPGPDRWKVRSRTPWGVAKAMAEQWG